MPISLYTYDLNVEALPRPASFIGEQQIQVRFAVSCASGTKAFMTHHCRGST